MNNDEKFDIKEIEMDRETVEVADDVAYDILHPRISNNSLFLAILLIFLVLLVSSVSFVCFSMANYYKTIKDNSVETGSIVYSFNESSNYIYMENVYPISDNIGKELNGDKEKYEFTVSVKYYGDDTKDSYSNYEVSLIPDIDSKVKLDEIRVYLEKNGEPVLINNKEVNYFSDLVKSNVRSDGYTLVRNTVNQTSYDSYVFRMWLSPRYKVDGENRTFNCYVAVNSY